jgi:hypothetical protein
MAITPPKKKAAPKKAAKKSPVIKKQKEQVKNFQGSETLPLDPSIREVPSELNQPDNITSMNTDTQTQQFTPEPADATIPPTTVAPACVDSRIALLYKQQDDLNKRIKWQEEIHRNVMENGNVTHYYNIVPSLLIAGVTGALVGLSVIAFGKYFKRATA